MNLSKKWSTGVGILYHVFLNSEEFASTSGRETSRAALITLSEIGTLNQSPFPHEKNDRKIRGGTP
jgi:hypothetical protein